MRMWTPSVACDRLAGECGNLAGTHLGEGLSSRTGRHTGEALASWPGAQRGPTIVRMWLHARRPPLSSGLLTGPASIISHAHRYNKSRAPRLPGDRLWQPVFDDNAQDLRENKIDKGDIVVQASRLLVPS